MLIKTSPQIPLRRIVLIIICCFSLCSCIKTKDSKGWSLYKKVNKVLDSFEGGDKKKEIILDLMEQIKCLDVNQSYVLLPLSRFFLRAGYHSGDIYSEGSLKEASDLTLLSIKENPDFFDNYYYGYYTFKFKKDYELARICINRAERIRPYSSRLLLMKADYLRDHNEIKLAEKYAKNAIWLSYFTFDEKVRFNALEILRTIYRANEELDKAEACYKKQMAIYPQSRFMKINYSKFLYYYKDDYDKSIYYGEQALVSDKPTMEKYVLAKAYYKKAKELCWKERNYKEAIPYFEKKIEIDRLLSPPGNSLNSFYGLGISYYRVGYQEKNPQMVLKAKDNLEKALELKPDFDLAKEELDKVERSIKALRDKGIIAQNLL